MPKPQILTGILKLGFAVALLNYCPTLRAAEGQPAAAVAADNFFAVDLYNNLTKSAKGNAFFSPYSIRTALVMSYVGARGDTAMQMASVLHLGTLPPEQLHAGFSALINSLNAKDKTYQLEVANALWGQSGFQFQPSFQQLLQTNYGAKLHQVNFAQAPDDARLEINQWVEQQTHEKIKDLLGQGAVDAKTLLILTNAIYFKADWEESFPKQGTRDEPFHLDASHDVQTPMMNHPLSSLRYLETDQYQAVALPYKRGELSMLLIVPKAIDGLATLEKSDSGKILKKWIAQEKTQRVFLTMPKFQMTREFDLADTLTKMGMVNAFDPSRADFSGMVPSTRLDVRKLFINHVVHKAFINVDEEGTEAAAATGVDQSLGAKIDDTPPPIIVTADRPFLFLIGHHASGTILFFGRVMDPRS